MGIKRSIAIGVGLVCVPIVLLFAVAAASVLYEDIRDAQWERELQPLEQQWQQAYRNKEYDTAIEIASRALAKPGIPPKHTSPWSLRRGKAHLGKNQLGHLGKAIHDFNQTSMPTDRAEAHLWLAVCCIYSGLGVDATKHFDAVLATNYDRKAIADVAMALVAEYRDTYPGLASICFAAAAKAQPHIYAAKARAFDKANGF